MKKTVNETIEEVLNENGIILATKDELKVYEEEEPAKEIEIKYWWDTDGRTK